MKRTLLILLACVANGFAALAQTPPANESYAFTVQQAIDYAYTHQVAVVNANLDTKSAEYRVKETTGIGLPQINGTASFTDYLKIPTTLLPGDFFGAPGTFVPVKFGVKYNSNVGITGSQILFNGSYLVGLQASKTYKELSTRAYSRAKVEVNVAVAKAYYSVLVSNEQIRLLDANIAQLKQQVEQTTAQNQQGFVEKIDVDRINVLYNNLLTSRNNVLRLLALNYQLLKFQMGMPIEANLVLTDKLTNVTLTPDGTNAMGTDTTIYRNRIEYKLQETQVKLNQLDLKNKKAAYLPTLSANGAYTASYQNDSFSQLYKNNFPSAYVGLSLNVPIFNGFQRKYQVAQSRITVQQAQNTLRNMQNALSLEASQANVNYLNGLQTLENQRRNQDLAREVLRVSKIKYQQGVGSSIEVTQAQTALEDADNKYIQGLYDALVSKVDLDRAYGRIQ